MNTEPSPPPARRPDLDALRAIAMLLGIALHAALSFFPAFWVVSDTRQNAAFGVFVSAIHGFRMPLFFVMSGFFSAMLLHRRGRRALVGHRFRRVFLPLMAGMVTIIPLTIAASAFGMLTARLEAPARPSTAAVGPVDLGSAAGLGDVAAIERHLASGADVDAIDEAFGATPLTRAALGGHADAIDMLVRRGANVNARGRDGGTALHAAAFLGHVRAVEALIAGGADVNAVNGRGESPLDVARVDERTTVFVASMFQIEADPKNLGRRKAKIVDILGRHEARAGRPPGLARTLMEIPVFNHLWFLWFLWWLVLGLATVSWVGARLGLGGWRPPAWLVASPGCYAWLVPLTMLPQALMGSDGSPLFGPDTSTGLLPYPHVLAYYAIFFGFGALYYEEEHDRSHATGPDAGRWWVPLVIALALVLPAGLALSGGATLGLDPAPRRLLATFLQAIYPWLMTFGLMGLFRRICPVESPTMRYLSDSAYWLYLAHLPLVIAAQALVRTWPLPAAVKFAGIVVVVTMLLLASYQAFVRYTWIGRFLNGARVRPSPAHAHS